MSPPFLCGAPPQVRWVHAKGEQADQTAHEFSASGVGELAKRYDLMATDASVLAAAEADDEVRHQQPHGAPAHCGSRRATTRPAS